MQEMSDRFHGGIEVLTSGYRSVVVCLQDDRKCQPRGIKTESHNSFHVARPRAALNNQREGQNSVSSNRCSDALGRFISQLRHYDAAFDPTNRGRLDSSFTKELSCPWIHV
jgi:hypothetical protein